MKPKRVVVARIARHAHQKDWWHITVVRPLLDVILRRPPEPAIIVQRGENPQIDDAGPGFYRAEVWDGDEHRATLFNVLTEQPCSRGLRW